MQCTNINYSRAFRVHRAFQAVRVVLVVLVVLFGRVVPIVPEIRVVRVVPTHLGYRARPAVEDGFGRIEWNFILLSEFF